MSKASEPLSPTVKAAFEAARLTRGTVKKYRSRWNHWVTWSTTNGVDPFNATNDDYRSFVDDHPGWSDYTASITSSTLACVYRHMNKDNPTQPATSNSESTPPTATAAFKAAGLEKGTVRQYRARWNHWERWCISHDVDPLAATQNDYRKFLADNPSCNKQKVKSTSLAINCVYRHIGKDSPARLPRPVTPGVNHPDRLPPILKEVFEAAGLSKNSINMYAPRWKHWEAWCTTQGIDPLAATHDDYLEFSADNSNLKQAVLDTTANVLGCVYRHFGKNNPIRPARPVTPTVEEQHKTWFNRFRVWCEDRNRPYMPAQPEDVTEFLKDVSESYAPYDMERARASIAWHHRQNGFRSTTSYPKVHAETAHLAHIEDKYPKPGNTLRYTKQMEACRERWREWCHDNDIDPNQATKAQLCEYVFHMAERLSPHSIRENVRAIGSLYEDPPPTKSEEVKAALKAAIKGIEERNPRGKQPTPARQEVDTEIEAILEMATTTGAWSDVIPDSLTQQQVQRIQEALVASRLKPQTLRQYVRYGWLPFKKWCQNDGTSIFDAVPGHIVAFLADIADNVSPASAEQARLGLAHVYSLCKPMYNPAQHILVRAAIDGMRRQKPTPTSQMDPITEVEYDHIRATAHNRRPSERPHEARLRGDTYIALIGTMRDAMLRKGEAATSRWTHVQEMRQGTGVLTIPSSKTDPEGEGAALYLSPPTMEYLYIMRHTMQQNGIEVSEDDTIFRLSGNQVYTGIKEACHMAGLPGRYGGHSPRIGMLHDLMYENVSNLGAQHAGRWKNERMPAYYGRMIKAARNAVAQRYARRGNLDEVGEFHPLSAYGLSLSSRTARLGH